MNPPAASLPPPHHRPLNILHESAPINHVREAEPFRRPAPPQPDFGPDPPDGFVHARAAVA